VQFESLLQICAKRLTRILEAILGELLPTSQGARCRDKLRPIPINLRKPAPVCGTEDIEWAVIPIGGPGIRRSRFNHVKGTKRITRVARLELHAPSRGAAATSAVVRIIGARSTGAPTTRAGPTGTSIRHWATARTSAPRIGNERIATAAYLDAVTTGHRNQARTCD